MKNGSEEEEYEEESALEEEEEEESALEEEEEEEAEDEDAFGEFSFALLKKKNAEIPKSQCPSPVTVALFVYVCV